jgi:acyl-CoA thioesterase-1
LTAARCRPRLALVTACLGAALASCGGSSKPAPPPAPTPDARAVDAVVVVSPGPDAATPADTSLTPPPPDAGGVEVAPLRDGPAPAGLVKMMVLGSSNEVRTCWRAFLWQKLRAAGASNFDFVGSNSDGPDCGVPGYDKDDESESGTIVTGISADEYTRRFKAHPADIVLVHFGGADLLQGIAPAKVIPGYTLMVMQARALNPQVRFLVAQHTPMDPGSCAACKMSVPALNAAIVQWAAQIGTAASPVSAVDLFTGVDPASDTSDHVHLNDAGARKVADRWTEALLPILHP